MAVNPEFEAKLADGYHSLMLAYATGSLNQAENLIVSAHVSMSHKGRKVLSHYESLCGALFENECAPVAMSDDSLQNLMSRIDESVDNRSDIKHSNFLKDVCVPSCLHGALLEQNKKPEWSFIMPGLHYYILDMECQKNKIEFLKAKPNLKTPTHAHHGMEITLILDGAYIDETGKYEVGDLFVLDEDVRHAPSACPEKGCICMVVSTTPTKTASGLLRLLMSFFKA